MTAPNTVPVYEWLPIESAPKSWEPVLVWAFGEAEQEDAEDEDREPQRSIMVAQHSDIQPGHWWLVGTMHAVMSPLYWMPLPPPPSSMDAERLDDGGRK